MQPARECGEAGQGVACEELGFFPQSVFHAPCISSSHLLCSGILCWQKSLSSDFSQWSHRLSEVKVPPNSSVSPPQPVAKLSLDPHIPSSPFPHWATLLPTLAQLAPRSQKACELPPVHS